MVIFWNRTIAFGAMQNHRNIRVSEKIRDGFRCSSKWGFAHPELRKEGAPASKILNFSQPCGF